MEKHLEEDRVSSLRSVARSDFNPSGNMVSVWWSSSGSKPAHLSAPNDFDFGFVRLTPDLYFLFVGSSSGYYK